MAQKENTGHSDYASIRDTVESIGIAIILAFVLRAFVVEAFVIPTGSMAPRLMGEHWDLSCPNCGYEYAFGWPDSSIQPERETKLPPGKARCPNCFYVHPSEAYVNAGDRVLVMKYLYQFSPPQPWDVVVFKNPQNNRENYIKRLIGLPGEEIKIVHGDVYYRQDAGPWLIRRKTPSAQEAMLQVVHDNDYQTGLKDNEKKWLPTDASQWNSTGDYGRKFTFNGGSSADEMVFQADRRAFLPLYGYNNIADMWNSGDLAQDEIVTDLQISATFVPRSQDAVAILRLSSFENRFRASIGANGKVVVEHCDKLTGGDWKVWKELQIPPMAAGEAHDLAMANVDYRLTVYVDGKAIYQTTDDEYTANVDELNARMATLSASPIPTPQAQLGAVGGECDFFHVRLMRDEYYTVAKLAAMPKENTWPGFDFAYALGLQNNHSAWASANNPIKLAKHDDNPDLDSFFVLGDNSPVSLDGRAWTQAAPSLRLWKNPELPHDRMSKEENSADAIYQLGTVPRYNLIGKAFFVYWPSGFRAPVLTGLPIIPNVGKMRLIR
ncbi:MAG: signal peptidase I [Planctomycetaceae bacterium]|nr:MAG: signal peptidase I [Planctomycetaceae bacterium]